MYTVCGVTQRVGCVMAVIRASCLMARTRTVCRIIVAVTGGQCVEVFCIFNSWIVV